MKKTETYTIKLGDWIEGFKHKNNDGHVTSGYVTDIKDDLYMLNNGKVVKGKITRITSNDIFRVDEDKIILCQSSQYHPNSRSIMIEPINPKNGGALVARMRFLA